MAPQIVLPWVNDGKPFDLPDIPMMGDDELDALSLAHAKTIEFQKRSYLLFRALQIIAVKRVLDMGRPEKAMEAWKEALSMVEPAKSRDIYAWDAEHFVEGFSDYFRVEIEQRYKVKGVDQANEFLNQKIAELEEDAKTQGSFSPKSYEKSVLVTSLYWRLRDSFPTLRVDGQDVPMTKESLRRVIRWPTDWNAFVEALQQERRSISPEDEREEHLSDVTEDDLKKKSQTVESSAKRSKTDSPSTSAIGTDPAKK